MSERGLEALFHELAELPTDVRRARLDVLRTEQAGLAARVEALLASDACDDSPLDQPRRMLFGHDAPTPDGSWVGRRIGRYRLVRVVAAGGMGVVFEAEQDDPRRTVALKLMRVALAQTSAQRRFRYEAEILGRLSHPGIAAVLEAGLHQEGALQLPWFALEYVPGGETILSWAQRLSLSVPERLALFAKVCTAVHHGHLQGVIHRDLKPENILVDPSGQPKVIDFGVARVTDADLAVTTMHTGVGELVGTLQYMSPEQTLADPAAVDVRSDIYSLGIVLYELLCGQPPYDLRRALIPDAARIIRESRPRRPSTVAAVVRGDLEAITLKCLEKDRERRYASASQLARDIAAFLEDRPVEARTPGAWRTLTLFARRHRAVTGLVAALVLALLGGAALSLHYAVAADGQRADAERARLAMGVERDAAREAQAAEQLARRQADEFNSVLVDAWSAITPERARGADTKLLLAVLERVAARLEEGLVSEPAVEAPLRALVSRLHAQIGDHERALLHGRRAWELLRDVAGPEHDDTLAQQLVLSEALAWLDRHEEAEALARQVLDARRKHHGDRHSLTLRARRELAARLLRVGRFDEAEDHLREVLAPPVADDPLLSLVAAIDLAAVLDQTGRSEEAAALLGEASEHAVETLGDDHPETLRARHDLAGTLLGLGRLDEAADQLAALVPVTVRVFGDASFNHATLQETLAVVRDKQGREEEAAAHLFAAIEARRVLSDGADPKILEDLAGVMRLLDEAGRRDEALVLADQLLRLASERLGPDSAPAVRAREFLAAGISPL